jgi:hypothetical protein
VTLVTCEYRYAVLFLRPEQVVKAAGVAEGLGQEGQLGIHASHQGTEVLLKYIYCKYEITIHYFIFKKANRPS